MQISTHQMAALGETAWDAYIHRLMAFFVTQCDLSKPYDGTPAASGPRELEERVRRLVSRARSHRIDTELGIASFAIVGLCYSQDFDDLPAVRKMLADPARSPADNMQRVMDSVIAAEERMPHAAS